MRRYTDAHNGIERLRDRWGLGDAEPAPSVWNGEGPGVAVHPLPTTARGEPIPYSRPLPALPDRPLYDPNESAAAGSQDYTARQRSQLDGLLKGAPPDPLLVYPAWESRLVNMRDFLAVLTFTGFQEGIFAGPGVMVLAPYAVPQGYTAFLKEFRFFMDPLPAQLSESNTFITLTLDTAPIPDFVNLPLGALMNAFQKTFVIAEQGRLLGMSINITADVQIGGGVYALLYGNLRMRTGAMPAREVGAPPPPPYVPPPAAPVYVPPPAPREPPPEKKAPPIKLMGNRQR